WRGRAGRPEPSLVRVVERGRPGGRAGGAAAAHVGSGHAASGSLARGRGAGRAAGTADRVAAAQSYYVRVRRVPGRGVGRRAVRPARQRHGHGVDRRFDDLADPAWTRAVRQRDARRAPHPAAGLPGGGGRHGTRATGARCGVQGWRVRKDGSRFWADVVISPVRNGAGSLLGFAKVTRDLTERRRAEEALREREALLRATFEQAAVGIAVARLDARFVRTN